MCRLLPRYFSFSSPTNQYKTSKIINNLRICSPVYDDIHPQIIKYVATIIGFPLPHITNCSLLTGRVPSNHKIANVVKINKNGTRDDPYDYRPSKRNSRKAHCKPIICFSKKNNILYEYQFGFTPSRNTNHHLLTT